MSRGRKEHEMIRAARIQYCCVNYRRYNSQQYGCFEGFHFGNSVFLFGRWYVSVEVKVLFSDFKKRREDTCDDLDMILLKKSMKLDDSNRGNRVVSALPLNP